MNLYINSYELYIHIKDNLFFIIINNKEFKLINFFNNISINSIKRYFYRNSQIILLYI